MSPTTTRTPSRRALLRPVKIVTHVADLGVVEGTTARRDHHRHERSRCRRAVTRACAPELLRWRAAAEPHALLHGPGDGLVGSRPGAGGPGVPVFGVEGGERFEEGLAEHLQVTRQDA